MLVINPVTREVGTLFSDSYFETRFRGSGTTAWIAVDPLDRCTFHPRHGIVTPALQRVLIEEEARQHRAKAERERAAREDAAFKARRHRIEQLHAQDTTRW